MLPGPSSARLALAAAVMLVAGLLGADAALARRAIVTGSNAGIVEPVALGATSPGPGVTTGAGPQAVAITPDGSRAYVAFTGGPGGITPIDLGPPDTPGTAIPFGAAPGGLAVSPDGATVWVASPGTGLVPIDVASGTTGTPLAPAAAPSAVALTPDGTTAFVIDPTAGAVRAVTLSTGAVGPSIPTGSGPKALAITPDGRTLLVTNAGADSVSAIDVPTQAVGTTVGLPSGSVPLGIAVTPDGKTAFVATSGTDSVTPIDIATLAAGPAFLGFPSTYAVAISPGGAIGFVTDGSQNVIPFDTDTHAVGGAVDLGAGDGPRGLAFVPDQSPAAAFTATAGAAGDSIAFDGSGSADPDGGTVTQYRWDFGDGSPAVTTTTPAMAHTYADAGHPTVSLRVTDNENCSVLPVYTGQTASCRGSSAAVTTRSLTIDGLPVALAAAASPGVRLGGVIHDTVVLTSSTGLAGTMVYTLYGPGDDGCVRAPAFVSDPIPVTGPGAQVSPAFSPILPGRYHWVATYSGDPQHASAQDACGEPAQAVTIGAIAVALPVLHEAVAVRTVAGTVRILVNGRFGALQPGAIPLGSTLDTRHGRVRLTSARDAHGTVQTAELSGGIFSIGQTRGPRPVTTLRMTGPLGPCRAATVGVRKRHVTGSGHGHFTTVGNYASAIVRGTIWDTADTCAGTRVTVRRGVVAFRDRTRARHRVFLVPAGHTRFIRRPRRAPH